MALVAWLPYRLVARCLMPVASSGFPTALSLSLSLSRRAFSLPQVPSGGQRRRRAGAADDEEDDEGGEQEQEICYRGGR